MKNLVRAVKARGNALWTRASDIWQNAQGIKFNCIHCGVQFEPSDYAVKKHYRVCNSCISSRRKSGGKQVGNITGATTTPLPSPQVGVAAVQAAQAQAAQVSASVVQAAQAQAEARAKAERDAKAEQAKKDAETLDAIDGSADYVPSDGEVEDLERSIRIGDNVLLCGATGCGKTTLVEHVVKKMGKTLVTIQGGAGATFERIVAKDCLEAKDGVTITVRPSVGNPQTHSVLPLAMLTDDCVLYTDELNMTPHDVQAYLFSAMDFRRSITFDDGSVLKAKKGFVVISSMNEGYAGTAALNNALRGRSTTIMELNYLPWAREAKLLVARTGIDKQLATTIAKAAAKLRHNKATQAGSGAARITTDIGVSATQACARHIVAGASVWKALTLTIINQVPSTKVAERQAFRDVLSAFFGQESK